MTHVTDAYSSKAYIVEVACEERGAEMAHIYVAGKIDSLHLTFLRRDPEGISIHSACAPLICPFPATCTCSWIRGDLSCSRR
jgi:hypothetical protein